MLPPPPWPPTCNASSTTSRSRPGGSRPRSGSCAGAGTTRPRLVHLWHHDHEVEHVAFSPDGRRIVTASKDHTARVWDVRTGEAVTPPLRHGHIVLKAAFSPDGRRVVTGSQDRTARVWDASN